MNLDLEELIQEVKEEKKLKQNNDTQSTDEMYYKRKNQLVIDTSPVKLLHILMN